MAELLDRAMRRHRELGLDADWLVMDGDPDFYGVTKRLHHKLHGRPGGELFDDRDREIYRRTTETAALRLLPHLAPGDLAVLHDPQTVGMSPSLERAGVRVAWRLHIGTSEPNGHTAEGWEFLSPYLPSVGRFVFSLPSYVPKVLADAAFQIIAPSIDPDSPKNRELSPRRVGEILGAIGVGTADAAGAEFADRFAKISRVVQDEPLPERVPVILQVSRWDPLKNMGGVLEAFAGHVPLSSGAHLVLAGPDPADIPDDPEGGEILAALLAERERLPARVRARTHLVALSLKDAEANALAVNALQRRAQVVVQHSLGEGFGLTVTEAMWKVRPIIASKVGGLAFQIEHGVSGILLEDHRDPASLGTAASRLLGDPRVAERLGHAAYERCMQRFTIDREMNDYLTLYKGMLSD